MAYFPQLSAQGLMVQRPSTWQQIALTTHEDQPSGRRCAKAWRTNPLGRWGLTYPHLTDTELAVLEGFFASMKGRLGQFTWLDPGGNLCQYSDDFSHASWEKYDAAPGAAAADPFGGTRAQTVAGTGSNAMLATSVIPDGNASGFVLCGSVWVKPGSAQQLSIGFIDSGFTVIGNSAWSLPAGRWTRIWHTMTLATSSAVRLLIGGFASWGAVSLDLFGAQAAPLPGPGAYVRSPQQWGYRPKCRFDTDVLSLRYVGPNQNTVTLAIAEFA